MAGRRGERGFTLLELAISLAIVSFALLVAARLLLESQVLFARAARELESPMSAYAAARLGTDVRAARTVRRAPWDLGLLQRGPLELAGPAGTVGVIRWELEEAELRRAVVAPDGEVRARQTVLREVLDWRWREAAPGLVEVEWTHRGGADARGWLSGARPRPAPPPPAETERLLLALRGAPGGAGW